MAVMLIGGFTPDQAFIIFYFAIAIGHLNHANIHLTYGPLKYLFNNPVMHLWHHVWDLPSGKSKGINFGISLSTWDYIFKTAAIPKDDAHIKLGFPEMEKFLQQILFIAALHVLNIVTNIFKFVNTPNDYLFRLLIFYCNR